MSDHTIVIIWVMKIFFVQFFCVFLEKEMATHSSIFAARTPWTVWKGKKILHWKMSTTRPHPRWEGVQYATGEKQSTIPAQLFKILKDNDIKVLHPVCQQIWKTQQWPQEWKRSLFIPVPNAKEYSNYCTIALISHASKGILKILQAKLQQYMNRELPDVQARFRKGRGTRDQIANIRWITKKAREFQKNIYFCLIDYAKAFDCVDHNKQWKILKEMGIPGHLTCIMRNLYAG